MSVYILYPTKRFVAKRPPVNFFMKFGRTDLRRGVSGAKFDAESDFEVRLAVAPQNPGQTCEKLNFYARKILDFWRPNLSQASIFSENRIFEISASCTTLAWGGIFFAFRNGWPSYFQRVKFKHIEAEWARGISEINSFQPRKSGPKVAKV